MPGARRDTRWSAGATIAGIDRSEVMAIGDNYNDIEMLTFAGHPVIMGNASDDLKQNGWTVTLHSDEHGVAAAIEQVLEKECGDYECVDFSNRY